MKTNGKKNRRSNNPPPVLTAEEVRALIAQVNTKSATGLRNRAMLAAMLGAGLRVAEVVDLYPKDIDYGKGTVRVNEGKGGRDRVIPVDDETLAHLRAWEEKRKTLGFSRRQPFFGRIRTSTVGRTGLPTGNRIATRTVQAMVTGLGKKAGIEKAVHPHMLRHTYATNLLDRGFNIVELQKLLGHSDVSTTMIYTHVTDAALRAKIQAPAPADVAAQIAELREQLDKLESAL